MWPFTKTPNDFSKLEVIARTLWGEARGEGYVGMQAVANVIGKREQLKWKMASDFKDVCLSPKQFSCWNTEDPNRNKLLSVDMSDVEYRTALSIANNLMAGKLPNIVRSADSYEVRGTNAYWSQGLRPVASVGKHDFYITWQ